METREYAPGRGVDVHGAPAGVTVLLWHGMQTDSRRAVGPLAARIAARGLPDEPRGVPFTLVHGTADDVVPPQISREFAARLQRLGWPVDLIELPTDHGAIVGARYDAEADRYEPSDAPEALETADTVAGIIVAAVSGAAAPR